MLTEPDWEAMASLWQDDGVADIPSGSSLSVLSEEVPGKLKVRPGRAAFRGFHYVLDTDMELSYTLNTAASGWRGDLVVIRLDRGTNKMALAIKEGVVGGSTPIPDADGPTPELPLASYNVPPNSAAVPAAQVLDRRPFVSRRIRVTGGGNSSYPDGTLYYDTGAGRFYAKFRESGATNSEVSPIPKFREVNVAVASDSSNYPANALPGALVWDEWLEQLLIQTSWAPEPVWVSLGNTKFQGIKRRGGDTQITTTTVDASLTIPITARGNFQFEGVVFYRHATAGGTCSLQMDFPSLGTTGRATLGFEYNNGSNNASLRMSSISATATLGPFGAPTTGTVYNCRVFGTFNNATAASDGDLAIRYLNPSGTITILNGSYLTVRQV
ncbi:hypothetical protein [Nonomuraea sp. NPDC023979]|uniref:hypothetical protein n=1 Tax=Nonomuraea sp. NPDC023979 TaxID=3154796 RepID=UPI0033F83A73